MSVRAKNRGALRSFIVANRKLSEKFAHMDQSKAKFDASPKSDAGPGETPVDKGAKIKLPKYDHEFDASP